MAVSRAACVQIQRPERADAERLDTFILEIFGGPFRRLLRFFRRKTDSIENFSVFIADPADELGAARFDCSDNHRHAPPLSYCFDYSMPNRDGTKSTLRTLEIRKGIGIKRSPSRFDAIPACTGLPGYAILVMKIRKRYLEGGTPEWAGKTTER